MKTKKNTQKKPNKSQGLFITFEGTEGSGKSTLIRTLAEAIQKAYPSAPLIVQTREPGGSTVAEKIRTLILNENMDPWTELFLYEAARAEHLSVTLLPALEKGAIVLCDRFTDSTLAYQSAARGLPWDKIKKLNLLATQGLKPNLTVFLDIDPAEGLIRASEKNRFEEEGIRFQAKVRKGFLKSIKEEPKRWFVVPRSQATSEENAQRVLKELKKRFKQVFV